ncbi:MAG: carboxymuconolactone decarboxylase family protein [Candidatus Kapabacteria bacterium]|nr:carboxymuconolactone decarboxylase family protein [Candidatus Kapabacteria bacterium]
MNIYEDFHNRRNEGNDAVNRQDYLPYKRFFNLDTNAYSEAALPSKYKELMGLVGSMVLRCNDCILYHIEGSVNAGASPEEIKEAMNIALVIGGSIVIPHLRIAVKALEELTGD